MIPVTRQEISIRKGPLYFIAAVFIVFLWALYDQGKIHEGASLAALIGLLAFLLLYRMLSKNKLIIDNEGITQQLFFGKQKELGWKEIKSSHLSWHYHGHGASLQWDIMPESGKAINLQSSGYNRKSLRIIAEALVEKCPGALIDKRIRNIEEGRFPWYIF
jgi:hypothetical protein